MLRARYGYAVAYFFYLTCGSMATPVVDDSKELKYEEYIIEHEVSTAQARNAVITIDLRKVETPPGCQKCNDEEIRYCLGRDLINDHCCCDKRYREYFPFIPHTCYWGSRHCVPVVGDCAEYSRLRTCCCNKYTLEKWKEKSRAHHHIPLLTLLLIFNVVNMYVIN